MCFAAGFCLFLYEYMASSSAPRTIHTSTPAVVVAGTLASRLAWALDPMRLQQLVATETIALLVAFLVHVAPAATVVFPDLQQRLWCFLK